MKVVIIILVLIVIGFAVAIGVGVWRGRQPSADSGAPPTRGGKIDMDALEDWKPPSLANAMNTVTAPFAPKLVKKPAELTVLAGGDQASFSASPSKKDMRVARLRLTAGSAARITYACVPTSGQQSCPQTVCLCARGAQFDPDAFDGCLDSWRNARTSVSADGKRLLCRTDPRDDRASLMIYALGGAISMEPLAGDAATVEIR